MVQYLSVEGGVTWEFIEYDVLNPSDSIPKREQVQCLCSQKRKLVYHLTKVSLLSLGTRLASIWVMGMRDNSPKIKPYLRSLVISEFVSQFK